jgi:hypothetical protein
VKEIHAYILFVTFGLFAVFLSIRRPLLAKLDADVRAANAQEKLRLAMESISFSEQRIALAAEASAAAQQRYLFSLGKSHEVTINP